MDCEKSPLMHKHHIVPRYKGGTDEPENLVEVSITQHAMYHFCNYQLWGNVEDYVAWRGLSGQISEAEFLAEKLKIFSQKGAIASKKKFEDEEFRKSWILECKERFHNSPKKQEMIERLKTNQPKAVELSRTPEIIQKKRQKFKEIKHQQGEKNSQYGKMWITNGTKEGSYKINKGDKIPEGYRLGRVSRDLESFKNSFKIITPLGEVLNVKNLYQFCTENNLTYSVMLRVMNGKRKHHKGYKVFIEEDLTPTQKSSKIPTHASHK